MEAERLMSVRAIVIVWSLAFLAAAASVTLILASDRPWSPSTIAVEVLVGLAFVASGLVARVRRPGNRTGSLMILVGLSWFGGALQASDASLPYTLGYAVGTLIAAILIHLMLAFPSGRLLTRGERWVTAAMYAVALVLQPVWMLFDDLHGLKCDGCPRNALLIEHVEPLAVGLGIVTLTAVLVILVAVLVILMRRWRAASAPSRRVLAPVYLASGVAVGFVVIRTALDPFTEVGVGVLEWLSVLALLTVPLAFLAGLLRSRLARSAVATLVVELGETPEPGRLRDALSRALGDPSLELAYWLRDDTFVDADGHAVSLPAAGSGRVATAVEHSGLPVAALIHDESLSDHPELVDGVVATAGLALENERLQAQLRARLEDLRSSRARLVETADAERRRLERNLHDGAQQRLVALSLSLALAERSFADDKAICELLEQMRLELLGALAELRELARGIHPAVLTERGLGPALDALAGRAHLPVDVGELPGERLPPGVEAAAYYLIAEALANVAKYAQASAASVRVCVEDSQLLVEVADDGVGGADASRGSGIRGLADRVEALDGRLDVDSPPGAGTRVSAAIPL
jgi:signal transduction histidine kinase